MSGWLYGVGAIGTVCLLFQVGWGKMGTVGFIQDSIPQMSTGVAHLY
jgi:hypothetical protein